MPFFSVIIPLYNKESYIEKTLNCVLNQSFSDFEVIIVDDGSTDGSVSIVKQINDGRIRLFHQENQGVSVARNKGMELSESDYFCFLDADDEWENDFLETFYKTITKFSEYKVFSAAIKIETDNKVIPARYALKNHIEGNYYIENFFQASTLSSILWTSCAVFHKSVFHKSGIFDISIRSGQDMDLWIRIGVNYKIVFIRKILAKYVFDSNSLSRNVAYKKNTKIRYDKFRNLEKQHREIKKFLDLNRYSEIITSKLVGNNSIANELKKEINFKNLGPKKIILMNCPTYILKKLLYIQPFLIKLGLRKSFYK